MCDQEVEETEQDALVRIMSGMKFYDIYAIMGITTICTYRTKEQVAELFDTDSFTRVVALTDPDIILDEFNNDGIFCVELHGTYKNLKSLAEDLVISRISGMMEKEI